MKLHHTEVIQRKLRMLQRNGKHLTEMNVQEQEEYVCQNCGTSFVGHYCPNCGQKGNTQRLTFREALENLMGIFTNFERGFLHTCLDLCYRPGHMIRDYLQGHRVEYVKPIQLIFLLGTIYLFLHYVIYQEWNMTSDGRNGQIFGDDSSLTPILTPLMDYLDNPTILTLMVITFMILPNHFFFRKAPYGKYMNYAEHFYALVYMSCQIYMLAIILLPLDWITSNDTSLAQWAIVLFLWDLYQLMGYPFWKTVRQSIKSVVVGLVTMVTTFILFAGIVVGIYYALFGVPDSIKDKRGEEPTVVSRPDSLRSDSVAAADARDTLHPFDIP